MTGLTAPRASAKEEIAADLEDAVLAGRLAAGDQLPSERQLATAYRASRPVVREVLSDLAARGWIEVLPGRGAFVSRPNAAHGAAPLELLFRRQGATVRDLTEARLMLECEAAALAAQRAGLDDVRALEEALVALEGTRSAVEHIRCDLAFHLSIASATHNPVIQTMLLAIARMSVELMVQSVGDSQAIAVSDRFHRLAYEAIKARDAVAARNAIQEHLAVASQTYGPDYEERIDLVASRGLHALGFTNVEEFVRVVIGGNRL
jgi:GntR family transcriptional repressor for pyruvate dehydrogenase complex